MTQKTSLSKPKFYLSDGGLETWLLFTKKIALREFAAFELHRSPQAEAVLWEYFRPYIDLAIEVEAGFVFTACTWRAQPQWGAKLGYSQSEILDLNERAVRSLEQFVEREWSPHRPRSWAMVQACVGSRDDAYRAQADRIIEEFRTYHFPQLKALKDSGVERIAAMTQSSVEEAVGITQACQELAVPLILSFTVETNGRIPAGESLEEAIEIVDDATGSYPTSYMINCAHPDHFGPHLPEKSAVLQRIEGVRANASKKSHQELDSSEILDSGDPVELAEKYSDLMAQLPQLRVFGGCCGTDISHIRKIAHACLPHFPQE